MIEPINIVFTLNKKYLEYLTVLLESIWRNNEQSYFRCFVVSTDISAEDLMILYDSIPSSHGEIEIVRITESDIELLNKIYKQAHEHYPVETASKAILAWILPDSVEKVLYLDIDVIVNGDLSELYGMDFEDNYIIATRDITLEHISTVNQGKLVEHLREFPPQSYLCTGMLLLNVAKIRNEFAIERLCDAAKRMNYYMPWLDMDIYSRAFEGKIKFVDPFRYQLQFTYAIYEVFKEKTNIECEENKPIIIHYISKPWDFKGAFFTNIYKVWWRYAKYTPFYEKWNEQLIDGMSIFVQKQKFDRNRELLIDKNILISDIISSFFENKGFKKIGVYGAGEYGLKFVKDMPPGYEYFFYDRKIKKIGKQDVFDPSGIDININELDVLIITPFYFEDLRYELYSKYNLPIYTYDFILNDYIYKPIE